MNEKLISPTKTIKQADKQLHTKLQANDQANTTFQNENEQIAQLIQDTANSIEINNTHIKHQTESKDTNLNQLNSLMYTENKLRISKEEMMIGSGSMVCACPVDLGRDNLVTNKFELFSANDKPINSYGTRKMKIKLSNNKIYVWTFVVADISEIIIGIDFLKAFKMAPVPHLNQIYCFEDGDTIQCNAKTGIPKCLKIKCTDPTFDLLQQFPQLTDNSTATKPHSNQHCIHTTGAPVTCRQYYYNTKMQKIIESTFEKYEKEGIVQYSESEWCSPLAVVPKKTTDIKDEPFRVVGDFRGVNTKTVPDAQPLPHIFSCNSRMVGSTVFSKIDLKSAYYQIKMHPDHKHKAAIKVLDKLFEFNVMPYGLRTAAQTFQRFMNLVFKGIKCVFVYIDDIAVFSANLEQHLKVKSFENLKLALIKANELAHPKSNVILTLEVDAFGAG